jgi:uncharacterized protein YjeT (DUF2065 family)
MKGRSTASLAEQFGSGRAKALTWYALLLLIQQIDVLLFPDRFREVLWAVVSAACILAFFHEGGWVFPRKARRLANDESTKAHRSDALRLGFVAVMTGSLLLYALTFSEPLSGREVVRLIVSIGLATALLRLGYLEQRAYRDA